jgi:hypothetical protein
MITLFVGLLIFVLVYVVVKFLLEKVPAVASLADILGLVIGILAALVYVGALK